jgi:hypothetical protein
MHKTGYALITLIVFMSAAMIVVTAAVATIATNMQTTTKLNITEEALAVAESGADNAILRLIRDSAYTGESLPVSNGTATVTVTGTGTRTIVSEGVVSSVHRKVQVVGSYTNTIFTISSWGEIQ